MGTLGNTLENMCHSVMGYDGIYENMEESRLEAKWKDIYLYCESFILQTKIRTCSAEILSCLDYISAALFSNVFIYQPCYTNNSIQVSDEQVAF